MTVDSTKVFTPCRITARLRRIVKTLRPPRRRSSQPARAASPVSLIAGSGERRPGHRPASPKRALRKARGATVRGVGRFRVVAFLLRVEERVVGAGIDVELEPRVRVADRLDLVERDHRVAVAVMQDGRA